VIPKEFYEVDKPRNLAKSITVELTRVKITVKVKPRAGKAAVKKTGEREFVVSVKEAPKDGRANAAVVSTLANFLGIAPSRIRILRGKKSRLKTLEIL